MPEQIFFHLNKGDLGNRTRAASSASERFIHYTIAARANVLFSCRMEVPCFTCQECHKNELLVMSSQHFPASASAGCTASSWTSSTSRPWPPSSPAGTRTSRASQSRCPRRRCESTFFIRDNKSTFLYCCFVMRQKFSHSKLVLKHFYWLKIVAWLEAANQNA